MHFLVNNLSIHEQFHTIPEFREAFARLMSMRNAAHSFGHEVYSHRAFLMTVSPIPDMSMQQAIGRLAMEEQRAAMVWLTSAGLFWDDLRQHGDDDWLECDGDIVTDSAVGEAAFRTLRRVECGLISVVPSDWDRSPLKVVWKRGAEELDDKTITIENWRDAAALKKRLSDAKPPIRSWDDLRETSMNRFENLIFADDCFAPLSGIPFVACASDRILVLLDILDRFASAFDATGKRTPEGQQIYQDHFTGEKALFSDSSDTEKRDFCEKLTFPHPNKHGISLFCTWHGKVRHPQFRLHFSWPVEAGKPVYVMYAGPKITRQ